MDTCRKYRKFETKYEKLKIKSGNNDILMIFCLLLIPLSSRKVSSRKVNFGHPKRLEFLQRNLKQISTFDKNRQFH